MMKLEKAVTSKALTAKDESSLLHKLHPEVVTSKALTASGITLVALTVTIIVLLILAGIAIMISNKLIINKAVEASNMTTESAIEEQIEFAWINAEAEYLSEKGSINISKEQYYKQKIEEFLEESSGFENVLVTNEDSNNIIVFSFENQNYKYSISSSGKISEYKLLKGNVKIGDYIEYPFQYTDAYLGTSYTEKNGWRVIDDGTLDENSECVKIVSTGIPAKWAYKNSTINDAMTNLRDNFESLSFTGSSIQTAVDLSDLKKSIASKVTTITLEQINLIGVNSDLFNYDTSKTYSYWLIGTNEDGTEFYYMSDIGLESANKTSYRTGVRPVIYLNENLTGQKDENNVWENIK